MQAAFSRFKEDVDYLARGSIQDTFAALGAESTIAVIPYENSIHGAVIETLELLQSPRFPQDVVVCETVELAINHCLVVNRGTRIDAIQVVYSHEQVSGRHARIEHQVRMAIVLQALGQCSRFLRERFPAAILRKTTSTAAAAEALSTDDGRCSAAICSAMCVQMFEGLWGLHILITRETKTDNFTRFLVVRRGAGCPTLPPAHGGDPRPQSAAALIRLRYSWCSDLAAALGALGLPVRKMDRRAQVPNEKFRDEYVAELVEDGFVGEEGEWRMRVEAGMERVRAKGGQACVLGVYRVPR